MASSLDDLLKQIRDEAKQESALVVSGKGGSRKEANVNSEEIDERILNLLNLERYEVEMDYATYLRALKEAMMSARMSKSNIPTEESELITNEFKRVKSKKGRFKVKKKKISVDSIRKTSAVGRIGGGIKPEQKLLGPAKEVGPIDDIISSLANIVTILRERNSLFKKKSILDRKNAQNQRRSGQESKFESSGLGKVLKGAQKIIAPVQGLLSKIFETFMKIIFGRFLVKFIGWISDPKNQGKINAITQFLSDHWPKLVGAYLLFGTSLGRFVTRITGILIKGTAKLLTKVLPQLFKFIASNPKLAVLAAGVGLFAAGGFIPKMFPGTVEDSADKQANDAAEKKGSAKAASDIRKQTGGPLDFLTGAGQERKEQTQRLETGEEKRYGFFGELAGGGRVSGPSGTDVIPARLTDGEFVMSKGAVNSFGSDFMESINAAGGGNNRPKKSSGAIYASEGGQIGSRSRGSGTGSPKGGYDTGSLSNNPLGALDRILGQSTGGKIRLPGRNSGSPRPDNTREPPPKSTSNPPSQSPPKSTSNPPSQSPPKPDQETSSDQTAGGIPERMLKSPTFRDSGITYLRSMLGGLGGSITEQDLSNASKEELNKAIARAKKRHGGNLAKATKEWNEAKKGGWDKSSSNEGRNAYATRKSQYERLKSGQVQVLYQDYYDGDDEKNITKSAENSKSILGQFWASATENGGYKVVNEKYDFVEMNDPMAVLRGDSRGIAKDPADAKSGKKITLRQKLQALHQLNPFAKDMSVDMVLGEKPNLSRNVSRQLKNMATKGLSALGLSPIMDLFNRNSSAEPKEKEKEKEKTKSKPVKPKKITSEQIKNNQAYAASKGKYYSSTTGKTYANYTDALKDPAVASGAAKTAKYDPMDPKNMTPSQRKSLNVEPPVSKTPQTVFNEVMGIDPLPTSQPPSNTLPSIDASSGSQSSNRFLQLMGIGS